MRMEILATVGILLLSLSIVLFYPSPSETFTLKVAITLQLDAHDRLSIGNITYEVLNEDLSEKEVVHILQYGQTHLNESGHRVWLALDLQGLSLPYHIQWTSPNMTIKSGSTVVHFFQNVEPGKYLLRIGVYASSDETEKPQLIEETRTLLI